MSATSRISLENKVVVVTGASRGIGEAIARAAAEAGATVVLASRKQADLDRVASDLAAKGAKVAAIACHTGHEAEVTALFAQAVETFGRVDGLVNNAATNPYFGPVHETDLNAFQKTVDVNIRGYFFMSARAVKEMAKTGGGAILNVASVNAFVPGAMQGIYSITKAAIVSMTESFARECAPLGVRVNALAPGATDTKFASALVNTPSIRDNLLRRVPMNRVAEPHEMAGAALYLVSPAASYTTGTTLVVDGGFLVG
jgi:NAD(P)-dependent dehydrogenase (short-subunit alcohol dehydrogenase family)